MFKWQYHVFNDIQTAMFEMHIYLHSTPPVKSFIVYNYDVISFFNKKYYTQPKVFRKSNFEKSLVKS